jgi:hypothetical protein
MLLLNFMEVSSLFCFRPIRSAVEAASCVCFVRSLVGGVDGVDYNMPIPSGYRVITRSQNTFRCFQWAN